MSALKDIADTLAEEFTKAVKDAEDDDIAKLDELRNHIGTLQSEFNLTVARICGLLDLMKEDKRSRALDPETQARIMKVIK